MREEKGMKQTHPEDFRGEHTQACDMTGIIARL
jgi:hypothetical protein